MSKEDTQKGGESTRDKSPSSEGISRYERVTPLPGGGNSAGNEPPKRGRGRPRKGRDIRPTITMRMDPSLLEQIADALPTLDRTTAIELLCREGLRALGLDK